MSTNIISVQDIINRMNDLIATYTDGSVDQAARLRAVNASMEFLKKIMTFPSDEQLYRFYYNQDTLYYDAPDGFMEGLGLTYDSADLNTAEREWTYMPYQNLRAIAGSQGRLNRNYYSWMPINGKWQIVMLGTNINSGSIVSPLSSLTGVTAENDAENLKLDSNIVLEGSASLLFDVNPSLGSTGLASIKQSNTGIDLYSILKNSGSLKLGVYLPTGNLSEITINLYSSATDYYSLSATTYDDGSAFSSALNQWKKVEFKFPSAVPIGSPNIKDITSFRVDLVLNSSFGNQTITGFRINDLYSVVPDYMDLVYLTQYKGTDKTGATNKIFLDEVDDLPSFGIFVPDIIEVVAMRAAVRAMPAILSNADFYKLYQQESNELTTVYGKSWPRKRILNYGHLVLRRS